MKDFVGEKFTEQQEFIEAEFEAQQAFIKGELEAQQEFIQEEIDGLEDQLDINNQVQYKLFYYNWRILINRRLH